MIPRIVSAWLVLSALPADAKIIFQSIPDLTLAPANSWCSSCGGSYRVFDSFTLNSASTIGSVTFAVQSNYGFAAPIDVSFWTNVGGTPQTKISSQVYAPTSFISSVATGYYTKVVTVSYAQSFAAGTYSIGFYNRTALGVGGYSGGGGQLYQQGIGFHIGQSAAFSLGNVSDSVPEPATWVLMLGGFGLVGAAARGRMTVAPV